MAVNPLALSHEVREAIARARKTAESAEELRPQIERGREDLPAGASQAVLELLRDGTYASAVARVAAEDPDLADE